MMNRWTQVIVGAVLGGCFLFPILSSEPAQGFAASEDLVGSLPVIRTTRTGFEGVEPQLVSLGEEDVYIQPVALVLMGEKKLIEEAIITTSGKGYVIDEPTEKPDWSRYVFFGDLRIELDRAALASGDVEVRVRPGLDGIGSDGLVRWKGVKVWAFKVMESEFSLFYDQILASGIVDQGAIDLDFYMGGAHFARMAFSVRAELAVIELDGME